MNNGFLIQPFHLDDSLSQQVDEKNWIEIDRAFQKLTKADGELFKFLSSYKSFQSIEFIISYRDATNDWEEDGIWHDDGSRILAFSLSLTKVKPEGGFLGIRKKGEESFVSIPTPDYGKMIIFKTGVEGYEHKIHRVTKGSRLIIAGWCS